MYNCYTISSWFSLIVLFVVCNILYGPYTWLHMQPHCLCIMWYLDCLQEQSVFLEDICITGPITCVCRINFWLSNDGVLPFAKRKCQSWIFEYYSQSAWIHCILINCQRNSCSFFNPIPLLPSCAISTPTFPSLLI